MPVYIIRAGQFGPVKIGFAEDVSTRLVKMQSDNHETLAVIRHLVGGFVEERALHQRFSALRLQGEWFSFTHEMLDDLGLEDVDPPPPTAAARKQKAAASVIRTNATLEGFGPRLRVARLAAGLTQVDLARVAGVGHSDISRYEDGSGYPLAHRLPRLAEAAGVSMEWLLSGTSDQRPAA